MSLYEDIGIFVYFTDRSLYTSSEKFLNKCNDFIVLEPSPQLSTSGAFPVAILIKCGLSTQNAFLRIMNRLNIKILGYRGLKDSNALTFQYINIDKPLSDRVCIENRILLKQVGYSSMVLKKGLHEYNTFVIKVPYNSITSNILEEIIQKKEMPNFFGHQRFGTRKPYNHEIALRFLSKVRNDLKIFRRNILSSFYYQALQSYVFNYCLSKLLESNENEKGGEYGILAGYGMEQAKKFGIVSAKHAECVENFLKDFQLFELTRKKSFFPKYGIRKLFVKIEKLEYKIIDEKLIIKFNLPPGSYASIIIREFFKRDEEWIFKKCDIVELCSDKLASN